MVARSRKFQIVIIGGGFAGLTAAQQLSSSRYDVTLIDPSQYMEWLPNIHEIISGLKRADDLRVCRSRLLSQLGHRFLLNRAMEMGDTTITLDSGMKIPYDACIVATGSVNTTFGVPGAAEYGLPMKSVSQCEAIARRLEKAKGSHRPIRVAVVGAGIEGVEVLGELLRGYGSRPQFEFSMVDGSDRLLPRCPSGLDGQIRSHTLGMPVQYHLGHKVASIDAKGIKLDNGAYIKSDVVIWSGGAAPNGFLLRSQLTKQAGEWAQVNDFFQVPGKENVFVIGDAANLLGQNLAKQAYHAIDMGKCAAANAERMLLGKPLIRYRPSPKPQVITFGDLDTFMVFGKFALSSSVLGVVKELVYTLGLYQIAPPKTPRDLLRRLKLLQRSGRKVLWPAVQPFNLMENLQKSRLLS